MVQGIFLGAEEYGLPEVGVVGGVVGGRGGRVRSRAVVEDVGGIKVQKAGFVDEVGDGIFDKGGYRLGSVFDEVFKDVGVVGEV